MSYLSPGLYADWRVSALAAQALAERSELPFLNERLLQLIWYQQRLRRDSLRTVDGQTVTILHPGFWNHEAGPDFRNAVIQFGDHLAVNGDVEIDLHPRGWQDHGHHQNPAYRNVVLHVVWEPIADPENIPTLELQSALDAPLEELAIWLRPDAILSQSPTRGQCASAFQDLHPNLTGDLLNQAAGVRLRTKGEHLQARARQVGWVQSLWEGVFGALGYKQNFWGMQRIAESLAIWSSNLDDGHRLLSLQARLLGISGLLPPDVELSALSSHTYLVKIWEFWWRDRHRFTDLILPPSVWRLNGVRPANHPQRRLALASHWVASKDLPERLQNWFATTEPGTKAATDLLQLLQNVDDPFWSRHWTLQSSIMPDDQPLIGPHRVTDLAINVILPWFWIRAVVGQNSTLRRRAEECYFAWPQSEDNAVLRLARQRLFGARKLGVRGTAALQQGVLQIVRDFCDSTNALCANCALPAHITNVCATSKVFPIQ